MKLKTSLIGLGCVLVGQLSTDAATLTWTGGSNTWDTGTTADWSNGSAVTWTAGSDAVIGKGSDTAGTINLVTTGGVTASSVTFNATGSGNYILSGTTLALNGAGLVMGSVGGFGNSATLLTANTSVIINNAFTNTTPVTTTGTATTAAWTVNSGATLTLNGGGSLETSSYKFLTTGQGKIVFASGSYNHSGQWDYFNNANTEIGNATLSSINFSIAYGGGTAVVTLNNAKSALNVTGALEVGGRANSVTGNGSLIVQSGTVNVSAGKEVRIGGGIYNNGGTGLMDITDGTVTAPIIMIGYKGSSIASVGTLKIGGGTLTSGTIMLGGTSGSYLAGSSATLLMTGGTVNLGVGGIVSTSTPTNLTQSITLSGGVITATADWSSSMAMALGTTNGNITFQAADASAVAHNITLNGALSGSGGLTKTGAGVMTLGGANNYTGATNVSAGQLSVNGSLAMGSTVSVGSGATLGGSGTVSGTVGVTGGTITDTVALGATTFHGTSTLVGTHTASSVTIADGTTTLSGTTTGGFNVNGATLAGSGKADGTVGVANGTINGSGLNLGATTLSGNSTLRGTTTASSLTVSSGTTTVSAGASANAATVSVAGISTLTNNGTLTGAVSVAGVFNGNGTVDGALTIESTGTLAPGNSPGTTTVTGILTVNNGAKVAMQLDGLAAGTEYDQIVVTSSGSVVLQTDSILDLYFKDGLSLSLNDQFVLIDNQSDAIISGSFSSVLISGSSVAVDANNIFTYNDQKFQLSYTGIANADNKTNDLVLTVVPEPSTWAMIVGGMGMLTFCNRLRRRSKV